MIVKVLKECEINVDRICVSAPVRYGDEDMPYDFPGRTGDNWEVEIDIESGQILNWIGTESYNLHMKVVDGGTYGLFNGEQQVAIMEGEYVPDFFPGLHYGDYLIFEIDGSGRITNWEKPSSGEIRDFWFGED